MKNTNKQKEKIDNLLALIKENPNLPIVPMVATEAVCDDNHAYWMAEWGSAKVDRYWVSDDRIYSYNEDYDDLVDEWIDNNYESYLDVSGDELEKLADNEIQCYAWKKAIIVYINEI